MHAVTIVIPVFNSAALARACIASCLEHMPANATLLVVDDAGTDAGITDVLQQALGRDPRARLVRNDTNLGFVGTCNRAVLELDTTDNDILLLNSDTRVTAGFLQEMQTCLYASERHGVCCPRSDAATLCSVPLYTTEPLSSQQRFDTWSRLREHLPRFHTIPTGVGFCMLIRRSLIRRFGLFDSAYGRGYNEENDLCCRLNRFGFSAILANRAFVFHAGGSSFLPEERTELEKTNGQLLRRRYPEYTRALRQYEAWSMPATERFGDILGKAYPRTRILYDLSHLPAAFNGTTEYALSLLEALHPLLSAQHDVSVLIHPETDALLKVSSRYPGTLMVTETIDRRFDLAFTPQQIFSTVHLALLNRLAVRIVVTMHDVIALRIASLHTPDMRAATEASLQYVDGVLSVSTSSLDDLRTFAADMLRDRPALPMKAVLHGSQTANPAAASAELPFHMDRPFVFFVGNGFPHKALTETLHHIPKSMPCAVLGDYRDVHRSSDTREFIASGRTDRTVVDALYAQCDCVVFPSQYEGFGLPLMHAAAYGKRIIAADTAVNRELRDAFGLHDHLLLFSRFEDIPPLIRQAQSLPAPVRPAITRTWADCAQETAAFIDNILSRSVDTRTLQRRHAALAHLELARGLADRDAAALHERLRQALASAVGRSLAPYPRIKRTAARIASALGLLH